MKVELIENVDEEYIILSQIKQSYNIKNEILFENKINIPFLIDDTQLIQSILEKYPMDNNINNIEYISEIYRKCSFIKNITNLELLKNAIKQIITLFNQNEKNINNNKLQNFICKLFMWIKEYEKDLLNNQTTVIYCGDIKKHECYFLILLALLEFKVVYINSKEAEVFKEIDCNNQLHYNLSIDEKNKLQSNNKKYILQNSINIEDVFSNLKSNQIEGQINIPKYFIRIIGINTINEKEINDYKNKILEIKEKIIDDFHGIYFENEIPALNSDEINILNKQINIEGFVNSFISSDDVKNRIIYALNSIKILYEKTNTSNNQSVLQNFMMKIYGWLIRYKSYVFEKEDLKVFYYGIIKKHEVYFLLLLSFIGVDIIYISPNRKHDEVFKSIDGIQEYSNLSQLNNSIDSIEIPKRKSIIRQETVAYKASQEIDKILYSCSEDTGLFKSWQLNHNSITPVILKTTLDEIKIIWNEPSNMRPGFKVSNNNTYIPTIFAKINGVFEDINEYWKFIMDLKSNENTIFIKDFPFSKINYDKKEFFSSAFLLNSEKLINKDELFKSNFYKLNYLNIDLQNLIIDKANELLSSDNILNVNMNDEFRIKVLMSAINLNEDILKLLQTYDFSSNIPKIILYYDSKEQLIQEDVITITLMSLLGFDIVMFAPTNYVNIENVFNVGMFENIKLPKIALDLQIPSKIQSNVVKKSFISRFFGL